MKANHENDHLILSTLEEKNIQVSGTTFKGPKLKKILGSHYHTKLKFDTRIDKLSERDNRKLNRQ